MNRVISAACKFTLGGFSNGLRDDRTASRPIKPVSAMLETSILFKSRLEDLRVVGSTRAFT